MNFMILELVDIKALNEAHERRIKDYKEITRKKLKNKFERYHRILVREGRAIEDCDNEIYLIELARKNFPVLYRKYQRLESRLRNFD